ncbi:MAG: hypothetical protein ABSB26_00770 [Nitrososphaerales archaeon]|jgi:hypothetical protein
MTLFEMKGKLESEGALVLLAPEAKRLMEVIARMKELQAEYNASRGEEISELARLKSISNEKIRKLRHQLEVMIRDNEILSTLLEELLTERRFGLV